MGRQILPECAVGVFDMEVDIYLGAVGTIST